ncbi:MAG: hypothetical protein OXP12_02260 [Thaumarchaeota archaeon]|nr:hypothetical protein [Nitrososphaerota archaeon]MDE0527000.1 hypothetical protein [Nitrososphaerota archaeon]
MMQTKMQVIAEVLRTRRYAGIAAASGAGLGAIYYALTMSMLPLHLESGVAMAAAPSYIAASISLTAVISGLAGINFALMAFKIRRVRMMSSLLVKKPGSARSATPILGGIFAAFTPGCPACTAPLAVILGAVGGLSLFPMQGLELKMISAGVLVFSIWWITRGLQSSSCCRIDSAG